MRPRYPQQGGRWHARAGPLLPLALALACVTEYQLPAADDDEPACEAPYLACAGECVDVEVDERNCGVCGEECELGEVCMDGVCEQPCPEGCDRLEDCIDGACLCRDGLEQCGDECVDVGANFDHCGECGSGCGPDELCFDGECGDACPDDVCEDEICVDLASDPLNCGVCGNVCEADELCVNSLCAYFEEAPDCNTCPCDCEPDFTCCYSFFVELEVCVFADACNP